MDAYELIEQAATELAGEFQGQADAVRRELLSLFSFASLEPEEFMQRLGEASRHTREHDGDITNLLYTFRQAIGGQQLRMGTPVLRRLK